jgi:N-acetylmuramoyl-L-alanine amidase
MAYRATVRPPARRTRRRRSRQPQVIAVLSLLVAVLLVCKVLIGRQTAQTQPPQMPDWVTQQLLDRNPYSRPGTPLEEINGLVVHYVGNPGTTAEQNRSYFAGLADSHETYASSHFIIGLDGEILQCVPLNEVAYCSNQRNSDTLSIECCHPDETGAFTQETYDSLVRLCAWLADYYRLDTSEIIRHYDVTGKACPLYFVEHQDAWDTFLADVEQALAGLEEAA